MVKKLGTLGFILVVVCAASWVCAGSYAGGIPAPQPSVMPAAAPACVGGVCPPPAPQTMQVDVPVYQKKTTMVPQTMMVPQQPPMKKVTVKVPVTTYKKATKKVTVCAPPPPKKLSTSIEVKMEYPKPAPPPMPVMACGTDGCAPPPPIPVAVPMWKFIVPWPPFVYYLPVE